MRNIDIDQTFAAIRQLPPEVELKSIELFVQRQPKRQVQSGNGHKWMKVSKLLILLAIAAASTVVIVIKLIAPEKQQSTSFVIELPAKKLPESLPAPLKVESINIPEEKPAPLAPKKESMQPEKQSVPKMPESKLPFKEESELLPKEVAAEQLSEVNTDELAEEESYVPLRVRTYTSSFCNFEGEDVWINAFVRALIREKIIIDTSNLHFTISRNFFEVNGKKQSTIVVTRYNELYTSITEVELNSRSRISLSVGESSCSLSKTIDE